MRVLLALLLALPCVGETASERLAARIDEMRARGWIEDFLAARDEGDAARLLEELESGFAPSDLTPEARVDRRLACHRLRSLVASFRAREAASRFASAWLPRPGALRRLAADAAADPDAADRLGRLCSAAIADATEAKARLTAMRRADATEGSRRAAQAAKEASDAKQHLASKGFKDEAVLEVVDKARAAFDGLAMFCDAQRKTAPLPGPVEVTQRKWSDYVLRLRWDVGIDDGPIDIFRLGERRFHETEQELERVARRIDPGRTWREIVEDMKDDHPAADDLLDTCRAEMERAIEFTIEKGFVSVPDWARNVKARWGSPNAMTPYGHYDACDPSDPELKGAYVVIPVSRLKGAEREEVLRGNNRFWIRVVSLHEAIPGHHLQFAVAARRPEFRRSFYNPAFVEGWGLYCEELMHRHGYYDDRTRLSQLKMRLWRCARAVIDVGAHFGGMTREEAIRLLVERVGMERPSATMEVDRYLAAPGYYSGYLIGLTRVEALRAREERKPGFQERTFHDRLLGYGPLPFRVIEEAFAESK